jgi:hypothetical protein
VAGTWLALTWPTLTWPALTWLAAAASALRGQERDGRDLLVGEV